MELHTIEPYYNHDSEILILGSFPSVKSRELGFYYAHPYNRFWKVLGNIFSEEISNDIFSKKQFLAKYKIALFDVCSSCEIKGSSDTSIKNVVPNDLSEILRNTQIKKIYINGKTAYNLYNKLIKNKINIEAIYLPSTSPANATFSLTDLVNSYRIIKDNVNRKE